MYSPWAKSYFPVGKSTSGTATFFKTIDPKRTTANHIARMCSAWMTHAQSHASFTN